MRCHNRLLVFAALLIVPIALASAETESSTLACSKSAGFLADDLAPSGRHYAPDREVQVLHIAIDVTPDFQQRTVAGQAAIKFKPGVKPVRQLALDAVDLTVHAVTSTGKIQGYQVTKDQIIITFAAEIAPGAETSVTITYQAEPKLGLYFRTPEMGYKMGDTHLFTQGEAIESRHWYPCLDSPNHLTTSEVTCRVPEGMTVISNGRQDSSKREPATGLVAFHWMQEKPHANYLITMCAGYFKKIEGKYRDVPLAFYTPASQIENAPNSFRDTKDMMAFFEQEIGVPYPWGKYDQVCVNDFMVGGMENTSATTLNDNTLFTAAFENTRSSQGLVAHELAHQWWGNLVTCKDWSHLWLNEGFATYYETLYKEHKEGHDDLVYEMYNRARTITSLTNDVTPIVRRNYQSPREMFDVLNYAKGSWVLHMLRSQLGADLYRRCINTYIQRHQHQNVVTEDLRRVIEEITGRSHDQFFDQWVYHAHHPELVAAHEWSEQTKLAKISLRQVQRLDANVLLFSFPLTIRFKGAFGTIDQTIQVNQKEEDFYFALKSAPETVRLDPDYTLLAKVEFAQPNAMLFAQLEAKDDVAGRLLAVEQLSTKQDKQSVARLKQALNNDSFYGVRLEAAKALRKNHSDEAFEALLASSAQLDARVRRQVVSDTAGFYRDEACESARIILEHEQNPDILAQAIRALGNYSKPVVREKLLKYLNSESFRNELAVAAVDAMRTQDDPAYIAPLLASLPQREAAYPGRSFGKALGALAYLARNEDDKDEVCKLLLSYVNSKKSPVQLASLGALGTLGDPKALAVLETFASASRESNERAAAIQAIAKIRAGRKPVDDLKNLRQEVLDLQKSSRELRRELDDLKKKADPKQSTDFKSKKRPTGPAIKR